MRLTRLVTCTALLVGAVVVVPTATAAAPPMRYEAEAPPATCDGSIDSNHAGYSGSGFCNGDNAVGAAAQFTVNAPDSGPATIDVRFANGSGNSWDIGGSWPLVSTDPSTITGPRHSDGAIPSSQFLRPSNGADVGARF